MNKQAIITALLALVWAAGQAQEIKMNEPSINDYLPLLNAKGYMAYSFNTKKLKGVEVEPVVMEYEPMLSLRSPKPPVPTVENVSVMASYNGRPVMHKAIISIIVIPR